MKHYLDHFELFRVDETDSTNNAVRNYESKSDKEFIVLSTEFQTAGKGQRGNSWESERGKNLVFSISFCPTFLPVQKQFLLSQIISLSILDVFRRYIRRFSIKWPNDIYWRDRKVGGILIENDIADGCISRCIIGVGLNINQTEFVSGAPNPVSLLQICGIHCKRIHVLENILKHFEEYYRMLQAGNLEIIRDRYSKALFWKRDFHTYRDAQGEFIAQFHHVEDNGLIVLEDNNGRLRSYAFKEVSFVL